MVSGFNILANILGDVARISAFICESCSPAAGTSQFSSVLQGVPDLR